MTESFCRYYYSFIWQNLDDILSFQIMILICDYLNPKPVSGKSKVSREVYKFLQSSTLGNFWIQFM